MRVAALGAQEAGRARAGDLVVESSDGWWDGAARTGGGMVELGRTVVSAGGGWLVQRRGNPDTTDTHDFWPSWGRRMAPRWAPNLFLNHEKSEEKHMLWQPFDKFM